MMEENEIFKRTELLLGSEILGEIKKKRVILFGVGGVGSWCAESLVRSGIRELTIVDSDRVAASNINRQLIATTKTVGMVKVELMKQRLLEINPDAIITTFEKIYSEETSQIFDLPSFDYIIDAIDSLEHKVNLIQKATNTNATFFSSMGAALKMDPSRIQVAEFWKVRGCPLGAALRRKIKKGDKPAKKFLCVFSDEVLENKGTKVLEDVTPIAGTWDSKKAQINGTLMHVTASFGLRLTSLVIQDIYKKYISSK